MATSEGPRHVLEVNRAAVLTMWAAVVAERLGFERSEALSLGRAVAGLNAYAKGAALGLFAPTPEDVRARRREVRSREGIEVDLLGRAVPARDTPDGLRALAKDRPIDPAGVERYLAAKFCGALDDAFEAMRALARAHPPATLAGKACALYECFRPAVARGRAGWGQAGRLDLDAIRALARADRV